MRVFEMVRQTKPYSEKTFKKFFGNGSCCLWLEDNLICDLDITFLSNYIRIAQVKKLYTKKAE